MCVLTTPRKSLLYVNRKIGVGSWDRLPLPRALVGVVLERG